MTASILEGRRSRPPGFGQDRVTHGDRNELTLVSTVFLPQVSFPAPHRTCTPGHEQSVGQGESSLSTTQALRPGTRDATIATATLAPGTLQRRVRPHW